MQLAYYAQAFDGKKRVSGTDDNSIPTANSLIIAAKIPTWLVHIKDASHSLMDQYPDKFNKVLQTFLSTTTNPG